MSVVNLFLYFLLVKNSLDKMEKHRDQKKIRQSIEKNSLLQSEIELFFFLLETRKINIFYKLSFFSSSSVRQFGLF